MRCLWVLMALWVSLGLSTLTPAGAQLAFNGAGKALPEVQVTVVGQDIALNQAGSTTLRLHITIPPDHHGYLDTGDEGFYLPLAFTFTPLEERGVQVTEISRPIGTREEQVGATVLRGTGEFTFRLETTNRTVLAGDTIPVMLRHQICNDITNVCYAPKDIVVPLRFASILAREPGIASGGQRVPALSTSMTLNERLTALFRRHTTSGGLALVFVLAAGLLASATPCVYPVLPITSAFLMARGAGSQRRGRLHAFVYFVGMIFFYTLLGLVASTTGTALSAIMTNAWVNLGFAMIFAYFGLSMLGLYEFQGLATFSARLDAASSHWGGFSGTFFLGITAGLVVSPCVGPIAGTILLDITRQAANASAAGSLSFAGMPLWGLVLMASFGAGLGIPFLIVGLLSNRLPRSGSWLTKIKWLLGIPILYFAYTYYVKGMETAGVPTDAAHAILVGIVAIGMAVFMGALHTFGVQPPRQMLVRRAVGIVLLVIGVHFLYNGLGQSGILIQPARGGVPLQATALDMTRPPALTPATSSSPAVEISGNLHWLRDFALAQHRARSEQKPVFIDFYATWCANCKAFQRLAMTNTQLNTALQQAVLVKIYDTDAAFRTFQKDEHYPELGGVGGQPFLPLFAIYSPHGEFIWKGQDYQAVVTMVTQLESARQAVTP